MRSLRLCVFFLIIITVVGITGAAFAEKRVALIIGNSDYIFAPLSNPKNDAALMSQTLKGLGFEVITAIDASRRVMKTSIKSFGKKLDAAGKEGVGLFYYAGHGVQVKGANYLIPIDAEIETEGDVDIDAINAQSVLSMMEFSGARLSFVIMDACRNNPFKRSFRSGARGLAKMEAPTGSLIAYATAPGDVAADGKGKNSPYTTALAKMMTTPGLSVERMFREVRNSVRNETGNKQTPWESSSLTGGDFFFNSAGTQAVNKTISTQSTAPQQNTLTPEMLFWQSIQNSQNIADYEAYLSQFSQGIYSGLAKNRIASLIPKGEPKSELEQTLQFSVVAVDRNMIAVNIANVRGQPSLHSDKVGRINVGQPVQVTGQTRVDGSPWYRVALSNGQAGFVFGPLLEDPPLTQLPKTQSRGGTLRLAYVSDSAGREHLDPIKTYNFIQIIEKTMNRLVRPSRSGHPSPELAVSWSANRTANQWEFKLRKGVKFHDGSVFDSSDVVDFFKRIKNPETESFLVTLFKNIKSIKPISPSIVKFILSESDGDFPTRLMHANLRIPPKGTGGTIGRKGIGTGPFILQSLNPAGTTVLKANPNYWEGVPGVDTIEITAVKDARAGALALSSGAIHVLRDVASEEQKMFANDPNYTIQQVPAGSWPAIIFRTDTKPFDDVRVRKALRIAADRQAMADRILGPGGGVVSCDQAVAPDDQYRADMDCPQQTNKARQLLAEAGYANGIEIDIHTNDSNPFWIDLVRLYKQQVAKAGIRVNLVDAPIDGYWSNVWMKKPVFTTFWLGRPADNQLNLAFYGKAPWNESHWKNSTFDRKLRQAKLELDLEKRTALYHELQKILFEEGGAFAPFYANRTVIINNQVLGLMPVPDEDVPYHLVRISN